MRPGPEILERNLEALLQLAYVPAVPRASFRRALLEDFADRAAARAGQTTGAGHPPRLLQGDEQLARPRSSFVLRSALAAAAVLLAVFAVGQLRELRSSAGGAQAPEVVLAEGGIAVRHAPAETWRRAAGEVTFEGAFLEVATPATRSAFVALAARTPGASGSVELEPASRAAFHAPGTPGTSGVELEYGGLRVSTQGELEVGTPGGSLTLLAGSLRVAPGAPSPLPPEWPEVSGAAGGPDARWWTVHCLAGRVSLPADEAAASLSAGERAFLRDGRVWLPPTVSVAPPADETRREVVATAEPEEPATSEPPPAAAEPRPPVLFGLVRGPAAAGAPEPLTVTRFEVVLLEEVALPRVAQPRAFPFEHAQGAFELADVAPGSYHLFVRSEGHALWRSEKLSVRAGAEPLELSVQLEVGQELRGIVIDALTGNPIPGAVVLSETDAPLQILSVGASDHPTELLVRTLTGPDGGFELQHLSSGPQVLRATAPGYAPGWSPLLERDAAGLLPPVEFGLEAGGTIRGVVEDDAGRGVAGSQIITSLTDFTSAHPVMSFVRTVTDVQGRFEMHDLPEGSWAVLQFGVIRDSSEATAPDLAFAQVIAGDTVEINFKRATGTVRIHGVVNDPAGAPVVGRSIWLTASDGVGPEAMQSMTTGADGTYEFAVQPDHYALSISGLSPAEMYVMAQPDMTAGLDLELDLQLPGGSLSGQVRHAETGRGLGDLVLLCGRERGSGLPHEFVGKTASAADGTFEFAYLHPGRYEVVAISADGLAEERRGVLVVGEERLSGVELELWPGGALVLTIVGSDGPLPNAVVRFQDRSGRWMRFGETQRTSAQGRYAVPGMRAEPWTVLVDAEGYETLIETLSVPLGETLRARLELRRE